MGNNDADLGVKWPCFGEYHCKPCNRKWASSKAWKIYGQKCTVCDATIHATNLRQLYRYYCRECKKLWKHKWDDEGAECKQCGERVKPFKTHAEFKKAEAEYILPDKLSKMANPEMPIDSEKAHRSDLCERCTKTGVNCSNGRPILKVSLPPPPPAARPPGSGTATSGSVSSVKPSTTSSSSLVGGPKVPKVKNWGEFTPPPPPPAVNPWNRFVPTPKPRPQPPSRLQPRPSPQLAKSPPTDPKHTPISSTNASLIKNSQITPSKNGVLPNSVDVNGLRTHGLYAPSVTSPYRMSPKPTSNGTANGSMNGVNGRTRLANGSPYTSYYQQPQRQPHHADESSWNLWNCSIQ